MNLRNFLSLGLTETCMYMLSMSALIGYFRSQNWQITASRLLRRSRLNWLRHSMLWQYPSCWRNFFVWKFLNVFLSQIVCDCVLVHCKLFAVVEKAGFHFLELLSGSKVVVGKAGVRFFSEKSNLIPSFRVGDSLPKGLTFFCHWRELPPETFHKFPFFGLTLLVRKGVRLRWCRCGEKSGLGKLNSRVCRLLDHQLSKQEVWKLHVVHFLVLLF